MAWIESHQNLADHPKTRKLARILDISKPTTIGHLHCFWWWALDYADDGDLSRFDSLDIAIGAEWDGDPDEFLQALIRSGFVDDDDGLSIHDWWDYAGKLIERRRANAKRMREARARQSDAEIDSDSARAENVQRTQRARVERPTNQPTEPDQTEPFGGADAPVAPPDGTLRDIKGGRKTAPKAKPLPENGPAQQIVKAYCEATGLEKPVSYSKAVGQAQRLVNAGLTPDDIPKIVTWLEGQKWVDGGIDLGLILSQAEKWRNAQRKPAPVRRLVV